MKCIPAIDLIDGKCVRLSQGAYESQKTYHDDPLAQAQAFEQAGLTRLHLVDLDGARAGRIVNCRVLERICQHTGLEVDFGGGIRSEEALRQAFDAGARQVTLGSIAATQPNLVRQWLDQFGGERLILGADAKNGLIATQGWEESAGLNVVDFIEEYARQGFQYVISTDISRDGMLQGPSLSLYAQILARTPEIRLIASGGVSGLGDLAPLRQAGLHGVIIGKAIYEGLISAEALADFEQQAE